MKYLLAIIPPDVLHRVKDALVGKHIHGLTVSEARGFGQEHDVAHPDYRELPGAELTKKMRLEIVCHDEEVDRILEAFYSAAHTGHPGDGKVFVLPVLDAMRLKTGERGPSALGPPFQS
ncbi:MAG TPA: P-II family nitrogen regulator [Candidatus Binatia bacterium]|jgi:nitrogen regulatory protein P-II 1|nr:P-II family nitrogen regulator [Candidatus Binatia bacterium]